MLATVDPPSFPPAIRRLASRCQIAGLLLIWVSVGLITIGTRLQGNSPDYRETQRREMEREMKRLSGTGPGEKLNPAGRMALVAAFEFEWFLMLCFSGLVASVFTAGLIGLRLLARWNRDLSLLVAGAFGLGCGFGGLLGLGEAFRSILGGFATLSIGFLVSAAGLAIGAYGLVADLTLRRAGGAGPSKKSSPSTSA